MSLYVIVAIALASALASGFGMYKVQGWRHDAQEKERIELEAKERAIQLQRIDKSAVGHEGDKARIRTQIVTVEKEVERVVKEPFYVDRACLDDSGLRAIASAVAATSTASVTENAVPGPDKPIGWLQRGRAAVGLGNSGGVSGVREPAQAPGGSVAGGLGLKP